MFLLHALFLLMTPGCLNWKVLAKQCTDYRDEGKEYHKDDGQVKN